MSNHTPGPWKWVVEYSEYRDQKYSKVQKDFESSDNCDDGNVRLITEAPIRFTGVVDAWCDRSGDYKGIEIDIADARLIAAAPELLAACMEVAQGYTTRGSEMARAAIAKATGEKI
ncbi:MAG: hypothetical protein ACO3EL_03355 [Burkholderiaceae bacterium]